MQGIKVVNGASSSIGLKTILVSLFTQGALNSVADSSGSLTRVGRVTGLRGERPPKFCTLENIPAMHQRGGYRCALGAETQFQALQNAQQTQPKVQTRSWTPARGSGKPLRPGHRGHHSVKEKRRGMG